MNKRFLLILTDLALGGVTTAAANFVNLLHLKGDTVDVLVMDETRNDCVEERFAKDVRFFYLKGRDKLWNLGRPMINRQKNGVKKVLFLLLGIVKKLLNKRSLWVGFLFGKKIRFKGYDAVFAYRQCSPCYYFALNCVEAKKKLCFVHGDIDFMGDISTWDKYLPQFDSVMFVANAVRDGFISRYPELSNKAKTLYNVFNEAEITEKAKRVCDLRFDVRKFNIITVSRIEADMKGISRIPSLCNMLKDKYGDIFHWYVVGGGEDLEYCVAISERQGTADVLSFLGAKENPYNYMSQADIMVFPTKTEAYGMVVVESMVVGVPVVSARYPAVDEAITQNVTGLVAEQSVESLFECICRVFDNKELQNAMRDACSVYRYDNDRSYKQLMDVLDEIKG